VVSVISLLLAQPTPHLQSQVGEEGFWQTMGAEYARKLFAGVDRYLQQPHTNYLLTDSPELAPVGVIAIPTPLSREQGPGWWGKMAIFHPDVLPQGDKALYLDLDNVVCGPLDKIVDLAPVSLLMVDDMYTPGLPNGSAILFYPRYCTDLWHEYIRHPLDLQAEFSQYPNQWADQGFIATRRGFQPMQTLLEPGVILNSRVHIEPGADYAGASLVIGGHHPKPHESTAEFYRQHWIA
jgi:hypothetical protein